MERKNGSIPERPLPDDVARRALRRDLMRPLSATALTASQRYDPRFGRDSS